VERRQVGKIERNLYNFKNYSIDKINERMIEDCESIKEKLKSDKEDMINMFRSQMEMNSRNFNEAIDKLGFDITNHNKSQALKQNAIMRQNDYMKDKVEKH
jgi:23S rRNA maturation-related 3'-5' exoribonuclease YhaM